MPTAERTNRTYWMAVLVLLALGLLTIFSVGIYLLSTALASSIQVRSRS